MAIITTVPVLTDSKTLNEVVNCLTEHVPIPTQGKCEQQNIFEILIRAATQRDSIENTTKILKKSLGNQLCYIPPKMVSHTTIF